MSEESDVTVIDATSTDTTDKDAITGEDGIEWGDTAGAPPPIAVPARPDDVAVERAAEMALDNVVPHRDELLTLAMEARMLAYGSLVPKDLRGKPADVLLILLVGRDLGIAQTSALQLVYVVDGKPSLAPKLLNARLKKLKLGRLYPHPDNSKTWAGACVLTWSAAERIERGDLKPDGTVYKPADLAMAVVEFSWEDAKAAGLVSKPCEPGAHGQGNACKCKDNWKKYPQRMVWWRAVGYAADDYFPEASLGLYTPDELGAVTNEDGDPIDVTAVEIPSGFERGNRGDGGQDDARATPEERSELQVRIEALPDDAKAELRKRWTERDSLRAPSGHPYPPFDLPARLLSLVNALLNGVEAGARAKGWNQEAETALVRGEYLEMACAVVPGSAMVPGEAPQTPPEATEPTEATDTPDEPPEAAEPAQAQAEADPPTPMQAKAADAGVPKDLVGGIMAEVSSMTKDEVKDFLEMFSLPKSGGDAERRKRIVDAKLRDSIRERKQ